MSTRSARTVSAMDAIACSDAEFRLVESAGSGAVSFLDLELGWCRFQ
jgi:hypothetical protein